MLLEANLVGLVPLHDHRQQLGVRRRVGALGAIAVVGEAGLTHLELELLLGALHLRAQLALALPLLLLLLVDLDGADRLDLGDQVRDARHGRGDDGVVVGRKGAIRVPALGAERALAGRRFGRDADVDARATEPRE
eukprot:171827-Pleurochrysis_carterae.AAC.2